MGARALDLRSQEQAAQEDVARATQIADQRNSQLNTVIKARVSAEEGVRLWPTAWVVYAILATALLLMFGIWWL